ncbi:hypothetical protein [Kribbella sp. NPDC055071]
MPLAAVAGQGEPKGSSVNQHEQALAKCLEKYDIRLFEDESGSLRLGGDVNRMEEATLRGPCGALVNTEIQGKLELFYADQNRAVVACLRRHGVNAVYDEGDRPGIQIVETHPQLQEHLERCAAEVFAAARNDGL